MPEMPVHGRKVLFFTWSSQSVFSVAHFQNRSVAIACQAHLHPRGIGLDDPGRSDEGCQRPDGIAAGAVGPADAYRHSHRAILASNTSALDIDAIAAVTQRPQQVLGLHFFSPAHIMKLLEVVRGARTAPEVLEAALALGRRMGKVSVVAGNCFGFIGNRMLNTYVLEARKMLLEGAFPYQVDAALQGFGFAMGPFRMYDVVGIDLGWRARQLDGVGQDRSAITAIALASSRGWPMCS